MQHEQTRRRVELVQRIEEFLCLRASARNISRQVTTCEEKVATLTIEAPESPSLARKDSIVERDQVREMRGVTIGSDPVVRLDRQEHRIQYGARDDTG